MPKLNKSFVSVLATLVSLPCYSSSIVGAQPLVERASLVSSNVNQAYGAYENVQARSGITGDSDGDSVPDLIDVDDDNDTIPDDVEGTTDTDLDGVANCVDVDSDNDGITDLFETVSGSGLKLLLDADGDGRLDVTVAVGENGLADVVELSSESSTSQTGNADLDGDGIVDHQDLDVDNDGIPDVMEAGSTDENFDGRYDLFADTNKDGLADSLLTSPVLPVDSDQDGIEDFRDIDSDQDGITDRLESFGLDVDSDGQVDDLVDDNIDGLDDGYQSRATDMPDTDNDGYPDFRDVDSDGDGVTDSEEVFGGTNPGTAVNSSTAFNSGADAQNKEIALQTGHSGSVFGCSLNYEQKIKQPIDPLLLLMCGACVMIVRRRRSGLIKTDRYLAFPAIASIVLLVAGCATAQRGSSVAGVGLQPYAGIGVGASFLNADTSKLAFDQDKTNGTVGQLTLGLLLDNKVGLEARAADLGEATFTSGDAVGYQVADISALYKRHFRQYSGFARLGIGALFNDGDIRTTQKNKVHLLVGFGAEYNLNSRLALRAEWQGHDVDVMHGEFSVLYRFGANSKSDNPLFVARNNSQLADKQKLSDAEFQAVPDKSIDQEPVAIGEAALTVAQPEPEIAESNTAAAEPALEPEAEAEANAAAAEPSITALDALDGADEATAEAVTQPESSSSGDIAKTPSTATSDEKLALAAAQKEPGGSEPLESADSKPIQPENVTAQGGAAKDGANDALDKCLGANAELSASAVGCTLFKDLVEGLTFVPDTDELTESGELVLNTVADGLESESEMLITVAVHTAPAADANEAMFLTRRRTIAIIRYLSDKGVDATRLRPEAYGDTQPLADAKNPTDNDRVVLSTR